MAIEVKITKRLAGGLYEAAGSFSDPRDNRGPAEVLVKETVKGKQRELRLVLDSQVKVSKIMNREVKLYVPHPAVVVETSPKEGDELTFNQIAFVLMK